MEELKVTSPEEYAEKARQANAADNAGFLHRLKKTGAVVRLRRVSMEKRTLVGSLPMSLVAAATRVEPEASDKKKTKARKNPTPEQIEEGIKTAIFMRQLVVENCLEPVIRYFEGVGVYFVNTKGEQLAQIDEDDFDEMLAVICGEEGNDGQEHFHNRQQRRASAAKSRRKTLRPKSVATTEGQPA